MPRCNCCGKPRTMMKVLHWRNKYRGWVSEFVCRVCQRAAKRAGVVL